MNYKFKYAAGLPGYGINGKDGSTGYAGFSVYLADYNESGNRDNIETQIKSNKSLLSTETTSYIPGYPNRKYQNNDIFIDKSGNIFIIQNIGTNLDQYRSSTISLGTADFLDNVANPEINGVFKYGRYANTFQEIGSRKLVDIVFGDDKSYYNLPSGSIYGILPHEYAQIIHSSETVNGYNPYFLFNTDSAETKDGLALVRDKSNGQFKLGNLDDSNIERETSLNFDIKTLSQTQNGDQYQILSKYDLDASCLFSKSFDIVPTALTFFQDGSTVNVTWNNKTILGVTNDDSVNANLVIYPVSISNATSLQYEKETGSLQDTISKNKYKLNILNRINSSGTVTINGLDENLEYGAYIEYDINGWVRRTNKRTSINAIPQFNLIKFDPVEALNIDSGGNIIAANISSNVNWDVVSKPAWVSSITVTSGAPGSTNTSFVVSNQPLSSPERSGEIVVSGGGITRSFKLSQKSSIIINDPTWDSGWQNMSRGPAAKNDANFDIKIRKVGKQCIVQGRFYCGDTVSSNSIISYIPFSSIYKSGEVVLGTSEKISFLVGPQIITSALNAENYGLFGYVPTNVQSADPYNLYLKIDTQGWPAKFGSMFSINFSFFLD